MRILLGVALMVLCAAIVAAQLTPEEQRQLDELLARQQQQEAQNSRRQTAAGSIRTADGNVVIAVGGDNSVSVQIGNEDPVSIADIPAEVQSYSDQNLHSFATGFQTCRANDNSQALLMFMNQTFLDNERRSFDQVNTATTQLQNLVQGAVTDTQTALTESERQLNQTLEAQAARLTSLEMHLTRMLSPTQDGSSPANSAPSCRSIKAANASAADGVYYLKHPDAAEISTPTRKWGLWADGHFVLKVYCNFTTNTVYKDEEGGMFRIQYEDDYVVQEVTAPARTQFFFRAVGAAGGDDYRSNRRGGQGGLAEGLKEFDTRTTLYFYPGGKGGMSSTEDHGHQDDTAVPVFHQGGFNGGGRGTRGGSGGGGGSDVRTIKQVQVDKSISTQSLRSRFIVAGGGGGCGYGQCQVRGGNGGTTTGETGSGSGRSYGGSQSSGGGNNQNNRHAVGRLGYGGDTDPQFTRNDGGGGGGGYYGGSAAATSNTAGGGGSCFVGSLQNARMQRGGNAGNGYIDFYWREL